MNNLSHNKPFYLLDPKSPIIGEHYMSIAATVTSADKQLDLSVPPEVVEMMDVSGPRDIILALQHHPEYIEKMLFSMHFDFQLQEGSDLFFPETDWRMKPKYIKWFFAMSALEVMPFFMKDKEIRLYMLAGDYLAQGTSSIVKETTADDTSRYKIRGACMIQLTRRLFDSCKMFLFYCHGTGFNPKDAILAMLSDYSLPVHYADVYKQYQKDIKKYAAVYNIQGKGYRFQPV